MPFIYGLLTILKQQENLESDKDSGSGWMVINSIQHRASGGCSHSRRLPVRMSDPPPAEFFTVGASLGGFPLKRKDSGCS